MLADVRVFFFFLRCGGNAWYKREKRGSCLMLFHYTPSLKGISLAVFKSSISGARGCTTRLGSSEELKISVRKAVIVMASAGDQSRLSSSQACRRRCCRCPRPPSPRGHLQAISRPYPGNIKARQLAAAVLVLSCSCYRQMRSQQQNTWRSPEFCHVFLDPVFIEVLVLFASLWFSSPSSVQLSCICPGYLVRGKA